MNLLACLFALVLHVGAGETIASALDSARVVYARSGETTTVYIAPGTYYEELTVDVPGLRLVNAARRPSIALRDSGVGADPSAVRISWYYGHGYQYRSMGDCFNYGGKRTRCWNATVLVTAPDFYAEHIIFENSFNQYISPAEAADSLTDISQARADWTEKERPKRTMPVRPKQVGSTEVQHKQYIERAAAISFTSAAHHAVLRECRCVGHQDVLYGDQGASVYIDGGVLQGGVDFLFGGLCMAVDRATIVVNVSTDKGDCCYISASRNDPDGTHEGVGKYGEPAPAPQPRGMLFYRCHIRFATTDELARPGTTAAYLARPWRWWGETVWAYTTWDDGCVHPVAWHTGLTKGTPCPRSYEYRSQDLKKKTKTTESTKIMQNTQTTRTVRSDDKQSSRPEWVTILSRPRLPDGTPLCPRVWLRSAD